jgi:hypothetical protein
VKFLKEQPVTDYMLDTVGHHRQRRGPKITAKVLMMQRREGKLFLRFSSCQDNLQDFLDYLSTVANIEWRRKQTLDSRSKA